MPIFEIQITAKTTKKYYVEAPHADAAEETASQNFTPDNEDGAPERYEENTDHRRELPPDEAAKVARTQRILTVDD